MFPTHPTLYSTARPTLANHCGCKHPTHPTAQRTHIHMRACMHTYFYVSDVSDVSEINIS